MPVFYPLCFAIAYQDLHRHNLHHVHFMPRRFHKRARTAAGGSQGGGDAGLPPAPAARAVAVPRSLPALGGFPDKKLVRLRYSTVISLNPAAGSLTSYKFSCNGMYDPDVSGAGHQPMGFDEWMSVYRRYTVLGSKIDMRHVPTTYVENFPAAFGVLMSRETAFPYTSLDAIVESGFSGTNYRLAGAPLTSRAQKSNSVSRTMSTKKVFGVSDLVGEDDYGGNTSTNPTAQVFFYCWCGDPTGTTIDCPAYSFRVTVDYIAICHNKRILGQS